MKHKSVVGVMLLVVGLTGQLGCVSLAPDWLRWSMVEKCEVSSDQDIVPTVSTYKNCYNAFNYFSVKVERDAESKSDKALVLTLSGSENKWWRYAMGVGFMALGAWSCYAVAKTRPDVAWNTLRRHDRPLLGGVMALLGGLYLVWKNRARSVGKLKFEDFKQKPLKEYVDRGIIDGRKSNTFYSDGLVVTESYLIWIPATKKQ